MLILAGIVLVVVGGLLVRRGRRRLGAGLLAIGVVIAALSVYLVSAYKPYRIPSAAMEPTIKVGDRVLARKGDDWKLGDVVLFHPPAGAVAEQCGVPVGEGEACPRPTPGIEKGITFVKRVVAGPGDRIQMNDGHVIRNGRAVDEPYAPACQDTGCSFTRAITIPPGHVFVLGDNRGASDDSRFWGPVPVSAITGRAVFRYWPLGSVGGI